jgi:site-specific DNA recombinase
MAIAATSDPIVVYEPEARIVRLVFTWYTVGDGENGPLAIGAIVRKLESMGVPTWADTHGRHKRRGPGKWSSSVIGRMLKSELYIGRWHYGKARRVSGKWTRHPDDHTLVVEVPAIVDLDTWQAAQERRTANKANSRRNQKHQYLLARRVKCGSCGLRMNGLTGRSRSYYRCHATCERSDYARTCDAPSFRADLVDTETWAWVQELLSSRGALERGLRKHKAERDQENAPIRARLEVVDDLLTDNRKQLERLLDLYLSGDFPKEVLTERKTRLEKTILALEKERAGIVAQLEGGDLTEDQIKTLTDFVAGIAAGFDVANADFETRRAVIEALDVQAKLFVKDEEKWVQTWCMLGQERMHRLCPRQRVV